jgi:geranylgeranyl pyrophosphate synthase
MVLHLVNEMKDFVLGLENAGRDLRGRHLTLPVIYCYQELTSLNDRTTLLELWSSSGSSEANHRKLLDLLKSTFALPQILGQAALYMVQAENALKLMDPGLEKLEHQLMLTSLKDLLRQFQYYFSRFTGLKT